MYTNQNIKYKIRPYDVLCWAIENNDPITAAAVISNKPHQFSHVVDDPDDPITDHQMTIIMLSAYCDKNLVCAKAIVANRRENAEQSGRYEVGLHHAVQKGDVEFIELLLKQGARTSWHSRDDGTTPLHEAIASNANDITKKKMIDLLLSYGAELDSPKKEKNGKFQLSKKHWPWLLYVIEKTNQGDYNQTRYGRVLFKVVDDANTVGNLQDEMARKACLSLVKKLLELNVDKDWQEPHTGMSCLHVAVSGGHEQMMGLLLCFDCNPTLKNANGRTACGNAIHADMIMNRTRMRQLIAAGWRNHIKRENMKLRDSLTAIVQSKDKSGFFRSFPDAIFEHRVLPYLQPGSEKSTTLLSTVEHVGDIKKSFIQIKNSTRNFLREYKAFHIGSASDTSKNMASDLQKILDHEKINPARQIEARIHRFFRENTGKRAASLLIKHELDKPTLPRIDEIESKTDFYMRMKISSG